MSKIFPKINIKFRSNVILQHTLLLVIKITILVIILIQYTKRTLRFNKPKANACLKCSWPDYFLGVSET